MLQWSQQMDMNSDIDLKPMPSCSSDSLIRLQDARRQLAVSRSPLHCSDPTPGVQEGLHCQHFFHCRPTAYAQLRGLLCIQGRHGHVHSMLCLGACTQGVFTLATLHAGPDHAQAYCVYHFHVIAMYPNGSHPGCHGNPHT